MTLRKTSWTKSPIATCHYPSVRGLEAENQAEPAVRLVLKAVGKTKSLSHQSFLKNHLWKTKVLLSTQGTRLKAIHLSVAHLLVALVLI